MGTTTTSSTGKRTTSLTEKTTRMTRITFEAARGLRVHHRADRGHGARKERRRVYCATIPSRRGQRAYAGVRGRVAVCAALAASKTDARWLYVTFRHVHSVALAYSSARYRRWQA